jgi:hypothetical protein
MSDYEWQRQYEVRVQAAMDAGTLRCKFCRKRIKCWEDMLDAYPYKFPRSDNDLNKCCAACWERIDNEATEEQNKRVGPFKLVPVFTVEFRPTVKREKVTRHTEE